MSGDNKEIRFQGVGVSPGLSRGVIHVVRDDLDDVARYHIEPSQIGNEIARFEAALVQTRVQILEMQQKIAEAIGAKDAAIFDAHLLVVGIATDLGSRTSHTAIIARSLNIPAVVGLHDATEKLESGQHVLLDGYTGVVIVDPTSETLSYYGEIEIKKGQVTKELKQL